MHVKTAIGEMPLLCVLGSVLTSISNKDAMRVRAIVNDSDPCGDVARMVEDQMSMLFEAACDIRESFAATGAGMESVDTDIRKTWDGVVARRETNAWATSFAHMAEQACRIGVQTAVRLAA